VDPELAVSPEAVRRARRAARIARLVFYPLAAVVAAVLLLGREEAAGKPVTTKYGATAQGRQFELGLDGKGRPAAFATSVGAICPRGSLIEMPWALGPDDAVPFERDGDRLRVREQGDGWKLALDASVGERGGLRGTVSLVVRITPKRAPAYDCASERIAFSAGT